ncbi:hypothetical protein A2U01_0049793, partial [Trifolium medium]|nr:hypothetical protein [Trifolium medium]
LLYLGYFYRIGVDFLEAVAS